MSAERTPDRVADRPVHVEPPRRPFRHEGVHPDEKEHAGDACMTWHHRECLDGNGGVRATCGAPISPVVSELALAGSATRGLGGTGTRSPRHPVLLEPTRGLAEARRGGESVPILLFLIALAVAPGLVALPIVTTGRRGGGDGGAPAGAAIAVPIIAVVSFLITRRAHRADTPVVAARAAGSSEKTEKGS